MLLRKWEDIPEFMRNDEVKGYYDILVEKRFSLLLKRFFDIVMSLMLIIVLSPLFLILSIWIKIDSKGPVFYWQKRITQYGKEFKIFKFRTMIINADQIGTLVTIQNDSRITKIGKKIRKYRLDEIPQVFNVLFGDMSFVGTRPEVKRYVDAYTNEMKATLLLRAGVTSLASLNFKNEDEIFMSGSDNSNSIEKIYIENILPQKMKFNLNYIKNFGFIKDIILCLKTVI